jgi:pimeloyl-ACP methyl ester carboxylesterase
MKIRANGIEIECDVSGPKDGIPLILISGFGSQMTSWPDELYRMFTDAGIKLIRFDNRDVGLAQKWDGIIPKPDDVMKAVAEGRRPDIPYTLDDMAADAAGLLDALGIETAHIAGASMGGMIAQLVALNHPEKTRSLISIFSTTGDYSLPRSTPEAQAALQGRPPNGERATVIAHSLKGRRAYASTRWPFDEPRIIELIGKSYDRSYYPEGTSRQFAAIMAAPPRTERLKSLNVPSLVLHGSADTLVRTEGGRHTAQCIPGSEYHEVEGWGHDFPLEVIPILREFIIPFINRVEASRAKQAA